MPISPSRTVAGHLSQKSTGGNKISGRAKFRKLRGGKEKKRKKRYLIWQTLNRNYFFLCLMQAFWHSIQALFPLLLKLTITTCVVLLSEAAYKHSSYLMHATI